MVTPSWPKVLLLENTEGAVLLQGERVTEEEEGKAQSSPGSAEITRICVPSVFWLQFLPPF